MNELVQFPDNFKLPENENEILKFFVTNEIYKKIVDKNKNNPTYDFKDGPAYTSGNLHLGHALISFFKSMDLNFRNMHGFNVTNKLGYDNHGVPTEQMVSKLLGLSTNQDIRSYGVAKYNEKCEDVINGIANSWQQTFDRLGRFLDYANQYKTMDFKFMESVWWAIKQLFDKGLIYRAFKIMPYSIELGTPVSNSEASENFKDVVDIAIYIKFAVKNKPNTFFIAWTTTPWTLPSNLALAMNSKMEYVTIQDEKTKEFYIIAKNSVAKIYNNFGLSKSYEQISQHIGIEFKDVEYLPIFPYYADRQFKVIMGDFVEENSGSGIVHIAPSFGVDDFDACINAGIITAEEIGNYCPLDENGRFVSPVNDYIGEKVFDANPKIIERLWKEGKSLRKENYKHSYPHCWRTDTPLIYRAMPSYFIKVTAIKERMMELNQKINWIPDTIGSGRFHNWLKDAKDWCISRNRFFGTPIPIWSSDDGEEMICVGSVDELVVLADLKERPTNLHSQYIWDIKIPSKEGRGMLSCKKETMDCWLESGCVPFAQYHYPFENEHIFEDKEYLSDFICEASDQIRCWFYNLMVLSTAIFDKPAFKNVVCCGLILAPDGKKFSKRHGNGISPLDLCNDFGADAMRLYLTGSPAAHADSFTFDETKITEISHKYYQWLNAVKFFIEHVTKFQKDGHKFDPYAYKSSNNITDQWILARLRTTLLNIENAMNKYTFCKVKPEILEFIEELINWYIKFNRNRLKGRYCDKKEQGEALSILFRVLMQFVKVTTPFAPFLTETMYQKLKLLLPENEKLLSVHLCDYPKLDEFPDNPIVERQMKNLQLVSRLVRSLRMKSKNSTSAMVPLKCVTIACENSEFIDDIALLERYMCEEINVIKIIYKNSCATNVYKIELNPKEIGLKYRKQASLVKDKLSALSQNELEDYYTHKDNGLKIILDANTEIVLAEPLFSVIKEQQLILSPTEIGLVENNISVIVDIEHDESVVELYIKRLFIVEVQAMRKKTKLRPWDKINIYFHDNNDQIKKVISKFAIQIKEELLYDVFEMKDRKQHEKEIISQECEINGHKVNICITDQLTLI
jgi:isoleucyl-tRNA synthetase